MKPLLRRKPLTHANNLWVQTGFAGLPCKKPALLFLKKFQLDVKDQISSISITSNKLSFEPQFGQISAVVASFRDVLQE